MQPEKLAELEAILGIQFRVKDNLLQALTHRSYINENTSWHLDHNERLEFLGDAVLELVVTEYLYASYSNPEGELTNWRAALVNSVMLAKIAAKLNINDYILLSRGEAKDTGRARQYILANAIEAIIGAIYLDQGYIASTQFISTLILPELPSILAEKSYKDPKSRFQEESQDRVGITPSYEVLEEWGPDHAKQFKIGVYIGKELVAEGDGPSKQDAQQAAAEAAQAEANAAAQTAEVITIPVAAPAPAKVSGISGRVNYTAQVDDLMTLIKAVAEGKAPIQCVIADEKFLGAQARAFKKSGPLYPGVTAVAERSLSARSA
jgi:ribonuclease-3